MAERKTMTDDELKGVIESELQGALGTDTNLLSEQRRKSLAYYYGEAKGDLAPPEIIGRSKVVSTDVRNTIESMLPQLVSKFVRGRKVVQAEATKRGDEQIAEQVTLYLNHLFFKKNPGRQITTTWAKDGLLQKRGIVKCWWDTRDEEKREEYTGLTAVELARVMQDPEVEIEPLEHKEYPDETAVQQRTEILEALTAKLQQAMAAAQQMPPAGGPGMPPEPMGAMQTPPRPPMQGPGGAAADPRQAIAQIQQQIAAIEAEPLPMLYDVAFKSARKGGRLTIEPVPPDEFIISKGAKRIQDARMVGQKFQRTRAELKSMGYPNTDTLGDSEENTGGDNIERTERYAYDEEDSMPEKNNSSDRSQDKFWVKELYLRVDQDGDGIAEVRKIVYVAGKILDNEVTDAAPFASWCPVPMPHKFYGLSVADLAMESQRTRTAIRRAQLDNMYLQVNGRTFAIEGQVNMADLLDSRPGGVVRMKTAAAAGPFDSGRGDLAAASAVMEQEEAALENSTGWTRYSQGNDGKSLHDTLGGTQIITNKGDMRLELMSGEFGEGFVELFTLMLKLVCQNQKKAEEILIAGEWVAMDPREWRNQFDLDLDVGLGVGNKDQQVQHLMGLRQLQVSGLQWGSATPETIYKLDVEIAKTMGFKSGEQYFNDPKKNPPPPQPNPMQATMQVEQMKAQAMMAIEREKLAAHERIEQAKAQAQAQVDAMRAQMQQQTDAQRQAMEAERHRLQQEADMQTKAMQMQMDDSFRRWEKELDAAVRIQVANITSKSKVENPATDAATAEIATEVQQ